MAIPYYQPVAPVVTPPDHSYMNMIAHSDLAGAFNRGFMAVAQANEAKQRLELGARQLAVNTELDQQKMELAKQAQENNLISQKAHYGIMAQRAEADKYRGLASLARLNADKVDVTMQNGQTVQLPPEKAANYFLKEAQLKDVYRVDTPEGPSYVPGKRLMDQEKEAKRYETQLKDGLAPRNLTIEQWASRDPGYRYTVDKKTGVEKRSNDGEMYASEVNGQKFTMPYQEASVLAGKYRRMQETRQPRVATEQALAQKSAQAEKLLDQARRASKVPNANIDGIREWLKSNGIDPANL